MVVHGKMTLQVAMYCGVAISRPLPAMCGLHIVPEQKRIYTICILVLLTLFFGPTLLTIWLYLMLQKELPTVNGGLNV